MVLERKLRPIGPYRMLGKVVYGFKRGSKQVRCRAPAAPAACACMGSPVLPTQSTHLSLLPSKLGWPTANLDPAAFENALDKEEEGVYVGWATHEGASLPPIGVHLYA